jgi:hypothetical protein
VGSRPIMLTHGPADTQDLPQRTRELYDQGKAMGLSIELQWCAGADHGHLNDHCSTQAGGWLEAFLERTLGFGGAP